MKALAALLSIALLAGCATPPPMLPAAPLFHDHFFHGPSARIDAASALAMSPAMRNYVAEKLTAQTRQGGDRRLHLVEALQKGDLRLEYDAEITRTAAEAFDAGSGNCLALVMMTASFAKALGLTVHYQVAVGEDIWDRADDLYISVGHLNLTLEETVAASTFSLIRSPLVVDYLPPRDARTMRTREVGERTVVAMYLNNRAVESYARGAVDDAYWYAREALVTDPELLSAYVTLGVVYRSRHRADWSEQVLARVAEREPDNVYAMSNRVLALRDLGRSAEADALALRLARLDPHPAFSYFHEGMAALNQGRYDTARKLFTKEVDRAPYHHEFEYWLAITYLQMNDADRAASHMRRAMEVSTTRKDHALYADKLERLKTLHMN